VLRRGVIAGLCAIAALAAWVAGLATLRGLDRQGSSIAKVLSFDGPLPALEEDISRDWPANPARGPVVVKTRLVALIFVSGLERGQVKLSCVLEPPNPQKRIRWRRGLLVPVGVSTSSGGRSEVVVTRPPLRFGIAIALAAVVAIVLLALSPTTGLKVLACVAVMWGFGRAFLAGLLAGLPPLPVTLGFSLAVVLGTVLIISGPRRKGQATLAGVAGALLATGLLAVLASRVLGITGLESTGARFLLDMARDQGVAFDFQALALSGTMIVLLGSACDLAVGVASAVSEFCARKVGSSRGPDDAVSTPGTNRKEAFQYGMAVGRDTGATMVLTLVFALVGLRLPAFLFSKVAGLSPAEVVNSEAGALEIAQVLIACTGLLLTIPLTAAASAVLLPGGRPERKRSGIASLALALRSPGRRTLWGILAGEAVLGTALLVVGIILGSGFRFSLPWHGDEDTVAAHLDSARITLDEGRPDLALGRLWRARELAPSDLRAYVWLGHACYLMGWPEQAAQEFEVASKLSPDDSRPLRYLGRLYSELGRYTLAVRALEACKLAQPGDPELLCDLAAAYAGAGEWQRAGSFARQALGLDQDCERAIAILEAIRSPAAVPRRPDSAFVPTGPPNDALPGGD